VARAWTQCVPSTYGPLHIVQQFYVSAIKMKGANRIKMQGTNRSWEGGEQIAV